MRSEIEARLGLKAVDIYGLSEIMGPGVACECAVRAGLHGWEDHFLFEVIDPESGRALPDGEAGELVITTLTKQALPMLRYRTRDITRLVTGRCDCGRTHLRILRITGRNDDMLIIRGVNVYPSQIEAVLVGRPGIAPHYQIVVTRLGSLDQVGVEVEALPGIGADGHAALARDVAHRIKSLVGISTEVTVLASGRDPALAGQGGARARPAAEIGVAEETDRMAKRLLKLYVNGRAREDAVADDAAGRLPARDRGPHRHQARLRRRRMRRLHGAGRRRAAPRLPDAGRELRRTPHRDDREPRRTGRPDERAAAGLPREARHAVRLLHARHDHERRGAAAHESAADRGRDPRGARRQPVPLHRLRQDHRVGAVRRPRRSRPDAMDTLVKPIPRRRCARRASAGARR